MGETVTALAATLPVLGFLVWGIWWLVMEWIRERRRVRAAIHVAQQARARRDHPDTGPTEPGRNHR